MAAAAQNARFIRQGISDYRANHPVRQLCSLWLILLRAPSAAAWARQQVLGARPPAALLHPQPLHTALPPAFRPAERPAGVGGFDGAHGAAAPHQGEQRPA